MTVVSHSTNNVTCLRSSLVTQLSRSHMLSPCLVLTARVQALHCKVPCTGQTDICTWPSYLSPSLLQLVLGCDALVCLHRPSSGKSGNAHPTMFQPCLAHLMVFMYLFQQDAWYVDLSQLRHVRRIACRGNTSVETSRRVAVFQSD